MKTYSKTTALTQTDPLTLQVFHEQALFFDIETTGFSARHHQVYLIGCAFRRGEAITVCQYFAEAPADEPALLCAFLARAAAFSSTISFNGLGFDLPFLAQRCSLLHLDSPLPDMLHVDLFRLLSPFRSIFKLEDMKQKTLEQFLGLERKDVFSGIELIGIYHNYVKNPSEFSENALILHNADDLKGMLEILPILAYYDLFNQPVKARKAQANYFRDMSGNRRRELILTLSLDTPLPKAVSFSAQGCYFRGESAAASLKIPIYEEELKYFYSNYRDYYYLPDEDIALHKSVAGFVDKAYRLPASAANCYTRKAASYLPQWDILFEPFFKRDYKSRELFFELTDELKRDRQAFSTYASHVLAMMASTY